MHTPGDTWYIVRPYQPAGGASGDNSSVHVHVVATREIHRIELPPLSHVLARLDDPLGLTRSALADHRDARYRREEQRLQEFLVCDAKKTRGPSSCAYVSSVPKQPPAGTVAGSVETFTARD